MASLAEGLRLLKTEFVNLKREVAALRGPRAVPRDGRDGTPGAVGRDGVSPDPDEILAALAEQIPEPVPGAVGRDGNPGTDGRQGAPGPAGLQGETGESGALGEPGAIGDTGPQGPTGPTGATGETGPQGPTGADGASITDVKLEGGKLSVWIDGVKRLVGTIRAPVGPFTPGTGGSGGLRSAGPGGFTGAIVYLDDDHTMVRRESVFFSNGAHALTLLAHTLASDPILVKARSGDTTLTNPGGDVILPGQTAGTVTVLESQSFMLWPTDLGWEYNG